MMQETNIDKQVIATYSTIAEYEADKANLPQFSIAFIEELIYTDVLNKVYPVGTIHESIDPTNPEIKFGIGAWSAYGSGEVLIGINSNDPDFNTVNKTGGAKSVVLTTAQMPSHSHSTPSHTHTVNSTTLIGDLNGCGMNNTASFSGILQKNGDISGRRHTSETQTGARLRVDASHNHSVASGGSGTSGSIGSGGSHNNLQPYRCVYRWLRIA